MHWALSTGQSPGVNHWQVQAVCLSAILPPGEINPYEQAFKLLEQAAQAAAVRGSSTGSSSSSVSSGRYIAKWHRLNDGYNYIRVMAPENQV